jgi:hypothetical protein
MNGERGYELLWPAGLKHTPTRDVWFARIAALKPGMDLREISAELKESYAAVYRWADLFHYDFVDLRREGRVPAQAWQQVDWCLRDAEISRSLGISRERVRQVRASRGIGPSEYRAAIQRFDRWVVTNRDRLNGQPLQHIMRMFGSEISPQVARRLLRLHQIKPHDATTRWRGIDWRLPNRDLARIWSANAKYIANLRARLGVGSATWDAKNSIIEQSIEYQQSLAQEMIKSRGGRKIPVRVPRPFVTAGAPAMIGPDSYQPDWTEAAAG